MVTKFYLHNSTDSTTGLPSTEQSTQTAQYFMGTNATNNVMNTTIGSSQVSRTATVSSRDTNRTIYFGRWVSPPLFQTSISANTWTWNFAARENNTGLNFPCSNTAAIWVNIYIWRPGGGGSNIGTILDGATNADFAEPSAANTEKVMHGTFSGSAVASMQDNDVLIFEGWTNGNVGAVNSDALIYFDGTTENTTDNATVSNHASFLETPENLVLTPPAGGDDTGGYGALAFDLYPQLFQT